MIQSAATSLGPFRITREVEVALLLWIPTMGPGAGKSDDFPQALDKRTAHDPVCLRVVAAVPVKTRCPRANGCRTDARKRRTEQGLN